METMKKLPEAERLSQSPATKQPNSQHCFICGVENRYGLRLHFYQSGPGEVFSNVLVSEKHQGYPGVVHGGVVAAMLDEALGRAAMTEDPANFMVTATMSVRYRKPVPIGERLRLEGHLLRARGRLAKSTAALRLPDGSVAAEAEGTLARLGPEELPEQDLEALGWKVYPD